MDTLVFVWIHMNTYGYLCICLDMSKTCMDTLGICLHTSEYVCIYLGIRLHTSEYVCIPRYSSGYLWAYYCGREVTVLMRYDMTLH